MWRVVLVLVFCLCAAGVLKPASAQSGGSCTLYSAQSPGYGIPNGPGELTAGGAEADAQSILQQLAAMSPGYSGATVENYALAGCSAGSCTANWMLQFPQNQGGYTRQQSDTIYISTYTGPCPPPNPCTSYAGKSVDTVVQGGAVAPGTIAYDGQGCAMAINSNPVNIIGCNGGCAVQTATYTGDQQQSGSPPGPSDQVGSNCVSSSAGTFCSEDQNGKNCGTFNGDEVCPASLPPGTCESFASGGVACTAAAGSNTVATPPGPNNGTAGQPATPTGQVQAPVTSGGTTTQVTTSYYSSSTIAQSSSGVASSSGGQNVGNGGSSSSSGGSGSSAPSAANGDCGASGVNCSGDSTVPTLPQEPTIAQSTQTYTSALNSVPIVAAVSNIAASVPSGECPTATISVFGHDFVMDAQCTMWAQLSPLLSLCFLAMWTLIGVRILMSA